MHNAQKSVYWWFDSLWHLASEVQIEAFEFFKTLIVKLGLVISQEKLFYPQVLYSRPRHKREHWNRNYYSIQKIWGKLSICEQCGAIVSRPTKGQSLVGSLLYIRKCVQPARLFVNSVLDLLREATDIGSNTLFPEFHRNMVWFNYFLPLLMDRCISIITCNLLSQIYM